MQTDDIARVCHEANRAYCQGLGDTSQKPWDEAPQWQKDSAVCGVRFCQANPTAPASANHESWFKQKAENGWTYGPVKDENAKTHPCMVPFGQLPIEQQRKDMLFKAIVGSLS